MHQYIVEADHISKYYGDFLAVDQLCLQVAAGSIYGILGPNGAGKTSSLRMLMGIVEPDTGTRWILGNNRPQQVRGQIGYLPEERGLYPAMKARDAIAFMGAVRGLPWAEGRRRGAVYMEELGLGAVTDAKIRKLSKGMAQMVQLIGSLVHAPQLIVLDEPFSGLDPVNQERLEALVLRERARGATILFSTHVMGHAERLCDRLAIIARSRRRFEGTVDEARALLPMQVRYSPRVTDCGADAVMPIIGADAARVGDSWQFAIHANEVEALLARITASDLGVADLSIARPALHDAFVHIVRTVDAAFNPAELAQPAEAVQ